MKKFRSYIEKWLDGEKVKEILDICGIKTVTKGIGWRIA